MPSALFVSPHLDDVAFSCGGTMRRLANAGWTTVLCTVFTRSVPDPRGFALACQTDKGLGRDIDYMRLRRDEDTAASRHLGAHEVRWLDLPEAPHRGYASPAALFGPFVANDTVQDELADGLNRELSPHALIFAPQAVGEHVDHRRVRAVLLQAGVGERIVWYRDAPYAIRHPTSLPSAEVAGAELAVILDDGAVAAKLAACGAYRSQLEFQFGGDAPMRTVLTDFAASEADRLGAAGGWAEAVITSPAAAACLT